MEERRVIKWPISSELSGPWRGKLLLRDQRIKFHDWVDQTGRQRNNRNEFESPRAGLRPVEGDWGRESEVLGEARIIKLKPPQSECSWVASNWDRRSMTLLKYQFQVFPREPPIDHLDSSLSSGKFWVSELVHQRKLQKGTENQGKKAPSKEAQRHPSKCQQWVLSKFLEMNLTKGRRNLMWLLGDFKRSA